MSGEELSFVQEALNTNWVAPKGANIDNFEKEIAQITDSPFAIALNSGTAAIHLALKLLGVTQGDFVLVQSLTFCASANPVVYCGATPVFIGSEKETWNMCPTVLERALVTLQSENLLSRVKAIIPVYLFGMPPKMMELMNLSKRFGIPIIEDAAEALGSTFGNRAAGSLAGLGILSFNGNKIVTTSGGGMLLTNNKAYADRCLNLATQAREDKPYYSHVEIGYNYRLSNISAGIGRGQLTSLNDRIMARRSNFLRYKLHLDRLSEQFPFRYSYQSENSDRYSNRWLSSFQFEATNQSKGTLAEHIIASMRKLNIEASYIWKPLHMQEVFKDCMYFGTNHTGKLFKNGVCFPSGTNLSEHDWQYIISSLSTAIENYFTPSSSND